MQSQIEQETAPDTPSLLRGILHDAQTLVQQQLRLFQVEVKNDARRTVQAVIPIIVGGIIGLVACFILSIMAAEVLVWGWPALARWGAYGIVGGVLTILAIAGIWSGVAQFRRFSPLPDQTLEGLQENLQWKTKP
jgi:uncharacterized membrane protein YqjE